MLRLVALLHLCQFLPLNGLLKRPTSFLLTYAHVNIKTWRQLRILMVKGLILHKQKTPGSGTSIFWRVVKRRVEAIFYCVSWVCRNIILPKMSASSNQAIKRCNTPILALFLAPCGSGRFIDVEVDATLVLSLVTRSLLMNILFLKHSKNSVKLIC